MVEVLAPLAPTLRLALERPEDSAAVEALVARAFGPGRYAKTSQRVREGNHMIRELSFCAFQGETLAGTVRLWPIRIGETPALFLGPIAVDARRRGDGLGGALVRQACEAAQARGDKIVLLVGDLSFFGPLGFEVAPRDQIRLPGPVNPSRILWRALTPGAFEGVSGVVGLPKA
jgi:predicted N-acetyltransferase YhbS